MTVMTPLTRAVATTRSAYSAVSGPLRCSQCATIAPDGSRSAEGTSAQLTNQLSPDATVAGWLQPEDDNALVAAQESAPAQRSQGGDRGGTFWGGEDAGQAGECALGVDDLVVADVREIFDDPAKAVAVGGNDYALARLDLRSDLGLVIRHDALDGLLESLSPREHLRIDVGISGVVPHPALVLLVQ